MKIETGRVRLREFESKDAQDLFELDSDPDVMKFIGSGPVENKADSEKSVQRQMDYYQKYKGFGVWAAIEKQTNKFIGWFALKQLDKSNYTEIGYRLKKEFWNKGFATEVSREIVKYGFDKQKLEAIVAVTHPENRASQRVLEKSGLKYIKDDFYYNSPVKFFEIKDQTN